MKPIKISDTDKNADWIKELFDDVRVSEIATVLLMAKEKAMPKIDKNKP